MRGRQAGPSPGDSDGQGLSLSEPPPQTPKESPSHRPCSGLGPPSESIPLLNSITSLSPCHSSSPASTCRQGNLSKVRHSPDYHLQPSHCPRRKPWLLGLSSEALHGLASALCGHTLHSSPICAGPLHTPLSPNTHPSPCHFPRGPNSSSPVGLSLDIASCLKPSLN